MTPGIPDIAIYIPSLEGGGAERVMAILASGFSRRGYRVDLVLASASGPYLKSLPSAVRVINLDAGSVVGSALPLIAYIRKNQPRAVLSALSHANIAAAFALVASGSSARLVVSERLSLAAARRHFRSTKDRIIRAAMGIAYRRAAKVVVVAEAMIAEFETMVGVPREKLSCIYNPVVSSEMLAQANSENSHPWFADDQEIPVILGCGRLTSQKDFPTLIEAFRIVRSQRRARLVILGEGEDRAELEAIIASHGLGDDVQLPGFAANPFSFMRRSSVFVLSSIYEGMPGALIQAMACGAPVVSTDCPTGPSEILEGGKWGPLVPMGDPASMAEAIMSVLDAPPKDVKRRADAFGDEQAIQRYLEELGLVAVDC